MKRMELVRKDRILAYLDNIERQIEDIKSIPVSDKDFFLDKKNSIQIKAIKYSLACAIQDITRISVHISSALSLWKSRDSEAEAILALSEAKIIPEEFAEKIKGCLVSEIGSSMIICQMSLTLKGCLAIFRTWTILRSFQNIFWNGFLTGTVTNECCNDL